MNALIFLAGVSVGLYVSWAVSMLLRDYRAFEEDVRRHEQEACTCNVGAVHCIVHPLRSRTTIERILFEKEFDRKIKEQQR